MTTLNSAHALLLSTIQNSPIAVLKRAVDALESGPTSFAITRQLPGEIRALVSLNGGVEYGVTLTDSVSTCSCKSALYRGGICKHMTALCLHVLRDPQPKAEAPVPQFPTFHLAWSDGSPLCGAGACPSAIHPGHVDMARGLFGLPVCLQPRICSLLKKKACQSRHSDKPLVKGAETNP
jgi:hypothetical protein